MIFSKTIVNRLITVVLLVLLLIISVPANVSAGVELDTEFQPNGNFGFLDGYYGGTDVKRIQIDGNGKIVVLGNFATYNDGINATTTSYLTRLNTDGSIDESFNANVVAEGEISNYEVSALSVQSDNKILVGGPSGSFTRLNSNGTLDDTFDTNIGTGFGTCMSPGVIYDIGVQDSGKILVVGDFLEFNGDSAFGFARLNSDGTLDETFTTNSNVVLLPSHDLEECWNDPINSVAVQSDGKIIVASDSAAGLVRLNSDGTLDETFETNTGSNVSGGSILSIDIGEDGEIILAGRFTSFNGVTTTGLARLNSDGTLDEDFIDAMGTGLTYSYALWEAVGDEDGKIYVGGDILSFDGDNDVNYFTRLNSDGTLDETFEISLGSGFDGRVRAIAIQEDGGVLIGGNLLQFNGIDTNRFARLLETLDPVTTEFNSSTQIGSESVTNPEVSIDVSGAEIAEDQTFTITDLETGTATAGDDYILATTTLTIPAGDYTSTTTLDLSGILSIIDDSDIESDETINLEISSTNDNVVIGLVDALTYTITNDDEEESSSGRRKSGSSRRTVPTSPVATPVTPSNPSNPSDKTFAVESRDLQLGSIGEDVRTLQKFLNSIGYIVNPVAGGPGSVGNETSIFGPLTKAALAKYQAANGIVPAVGYFGPITRAFILANH